LVEQARNIYSFSHLTFQEYFTAREIERDRQLEILANNIANPRWKEVFYLTAEMLRRSDDLLLLMKKRIDLMLLEDKKLQEFLEWTNQKTDSVQFSYKNVAVRAFYAYIAFCSLASFLSRPRNVSRNILRTVTRDCSLNLAIELGLDPNRINNRICELTLDRELTSEYDRDLDRAIAFECVYNIVCDMDDVILQQDIQALKKAFKN